MMRALGPGSVSSMLKVVLDVFSYAIWVFLTLALILGFICLLLPVDLPIWRDLKMTGLGSPRGQGPMLAVGPFAGAAVLAVGQFILHRLRRIFDTLTIGDPFHPENVRRLRETGFALITLTGCNYLFRVVVAWVFHEDVGAPKIGLDLTPWFAVLVVFVLAEVFREGARLRSEAELTI